MRRLAASPTTALLRCSRLGSLPSTTPAIAAFRVNSHPQVLLFQPQLISTRSFVMAHTTIPVSRKSKKQENLQTKTGSAATGAAGAREVKTHLVFDDLASKMLESVHHAMLPLVSKNKDFHVTLYPDEEVVIDTWKGKFHLYPDHERQVLTFISSISGYKTYYYDLEDHVWRDTEDNHDLRGLIVRDLMRHCVGHPHFD